MSCAIRPARESDASAIAGLAGELGYPSSTEDALARLGLLIGRNEDGTFVAESGGAIVGWMHVFGAGRLESDPFAEIAGLVVTAGARGRGIGKALVEAAEKWARERGYRSLRIRSNVIRADAHRFYEGFGYERVKTQAVFSKPIATERETAPPAYAVNPIGHVESPVSEKVDENWGDVTSRIVILPAYRAGIRGLDGFSHVLVLTFLHQASFDSSRHLVRRPRGLPSMPEVGIFSQRAKDRPNPIGVTAVQLIACFDDGIVVRGLDAIDGTPVLDIKPYYPHYDRVESAQVPAWVDNLMKGYF
jgi:tRNA (adenine37-N6)-methyltransferase